MGEIKQDPAGPEVAQRLGPSAEPVLERVTSGTPVGLSDTRSARARRWSRLASVRVKNFKATSEALIPLADVTVLVGPNGSGKSSALQAIHWAARAASYIQPRNTSEMMAFERIDYLPSSEPLRTAHKSELKTGKDTQPTEVIFTHEGEGDEALNVGVSIFAARNRGGITAHIDGPLATPYKQRVQFITAYIPGLAGLSERESILAQPLLRRQAASGDAGGVLRNILWNIRSQLVGEVDAKAGDARLAKLNELLNEVHPGIKITVEFDGREDYHISARYSVEGTGMPPRPLETLATGMLQVVQIFAYLVLFLPKILLIDEPDAHLHPDKQERLIEALERAARNFGTQIVLTTHSPHIVRAASPAVKLVWMNEGSVHTEDDEAIRRLLGWGGLDKSTLMFVEDEGATAIQSVLRQWPALSRQIAVCRCFGIENLPKDKLLEGLLVDGKLRLNAIIHRDGDFMTAVEGDRWKEKYNTRGVHPWVTAGSDMEAYFCGAEYLSALYGIDIATAEEWRSRAASNVNGARKLYLEKRKKLVPVLWPNGGSPDSEALWTLAGGQTPETVKGKALWAQLKVVAKAEGHDPRYLDHFEIPAGFEMAPDLRLVVEATLGVTHPPAPTVAITPVMEASVGDDQFNWDDVVDLSLDEVAAFAEGAGDKTMAGLRILAERGPVILADALNAAGITNYGHFQGRVTRRTRTVKRNEDAYLFTWDDWTEGENAERGFGRYAISDVTYHSLRRFFNFD
ncbi:ABC-type cobalamin/Fe3+-siderophores transport system ATPase subunit [Novosphingobium chloroacetimidivorans]|uniref:ABC-type cobalamin/Fe3+-siderophores transport system ATPase subunit n=1 Tax=Novosphingobium chloroacetimidivorans TaxID=1428314 RepID=A0A7W7KBY4_9SPHN|nr:ATP-binding protein [Novosphingobium chloroacetimidivorans]MBB4859248.1 ABC-type cobalamin/Fe3+-siderophores transport system ATPase subunit [Novosphingobium chloroacetimidivorans]